MLRRPGQQPAERELFSSDAFALKVLKFQKLSLVEETPKENCGRPLLTTNVQLALAGTLTCSPSTIERVLSADGPIDLDTLSSLGLTHTLLSACGIPFAKVRGCFPDESLRRLADALDLQTADLVLSPVILRSLVNTFGAAVVHVTFLRGFDDAILVAGNKQAMSVLGANEQCLIDLCESEEEKNLVLAECRGGGGGSGSGSSGGGATLTEG